MLHCFECGADLPDNLLYCLHCGVQLDAAEDPTIVRPRPVEPLPKPVVPLPPEPQPVVIRQSSGATKFILGALLGAGLVILLLIVGVFMLASNRSGQSNAMRPPANQNTTPASPTPSPTPKPSPSPTPAAKANVNSNVDPALSVRDCVIISPEGGSVNLRRYCDTLDCSVHSSTLYIQVEPGTHVEVTGREPIVSGRYTWNQIKYDGETLWVSSARIDCE